MLIKPKKHGQISHLLATTAFILLLLRNVFADDAAVMAKLAKSLIPTPSGWSDSNPCKWTGVNCDSSGQVTSISLVSKSLSGELPSELGQLSGLETLSLQGNQLLGPLPSLSNLASLETISLDRNNFTSVPPDFLSGLTSLQTFSISENSNLLPWTIPESLTNSTALQTFMASNANIMGTIPDIFESFPSLQNLKLSYNNITGSLPWSFSKSGIQHLWLNNQVSGLTGRIDVIGSMSELNQAWLHVNKFTGPIPNLFNSAFLSDVQLRDNLLTGVIPDSLTSLKSLQNVSLQNNKFQGPVPLFPSSVQVTLGTTTNSFCNISPGPCDPQVNTLLQVAGDLGYPEKLAESWKGNDPCKSWKGIACDLGSGTVSVINFANQGFVGTISPAIANLTSLKSLVLNDNNLTGTIPTSFTSLKMLKLIDVSNNNISGQVPKFAEGVSVKTSGNTLIGVDVPPASPPGGSPNAPAVPFPQNNGRKSSKSIWVFVVIAIAAVIIGVLSFVVYRRYVKKRNEDYKSIKYRDKDGKNPAMNVSGTNSNGSSPSTDFHVKEGISVNIPIEVLREVTNDFSKDNIIGEGGFGVVYKGQLHDGTEIAVKRMEASTVNNKGINEFKAEIEVLTNVRHRNLVALHGFCVNGHERLLVYEYMPQGTLGQHLFNRHENGSSRLTWRQRLSIALDVARGVEYLHSLAQQCFIHRDLKPSNILLGDDMRAKVSDFGLVKSAPDGKHSLETRLAGTFGYLAPEYAATGRVTTKVDVFAFGVILMELITGQKALDDTLPDEKCHLVTWFRRVIVNMENIRSSLDPSLDPDEETFKSICRIAELAGHCTAREPSQRPDMGHVVGVLSPLIVQWTPSSRNEDKSIGIDLHMSLPQALQRWRASEGNSTASDLFSEYSPTDTSSAPKGPSGVTQSFT